MLLPRRVNEQRHHVLRDMLVLGCFRVEHCVGYDEDPEALWREPAWLVHGIDRDEAITFVRVRRTRGAAVRTGFAPGETCRQIRAGHLGGRPAGV